MDLQNKTALKDRAGTLRARERTTVNLPGVVDDSGSDEPPRRKSAPNSGGVIPGPFSRSVPSEGISRPTSIHEIETHREHIRLNLENWEKQWADVLRYERAKGEDKANTAAIGGALGRSLAFFALGLSAFVPAVTDPEPLAVLLFELITLREALLMIGTASIMVTVASLSHALSTWVARQASRKSRTQPQLPPVQLDAVQLLSSLEAEGDPLYYRERDVAADMDFGWKLGKADPPKPARGDDG